MTIKKYLILTALCCLFLLPQFAGAAGTAGLTISPLTGSFDVGQKLFAVIYIDPGTEKIDMVRPNITFTPETLEIKSFTTNPLFSYQAGSNSFDNAKGTFTWGAGTPGGTTTFTNFGTITFNVLKAGEAQIVIEESSLVLSAGENKFNGKISSAGYTMVAPLPAPKKQTVTTQVKQDSTEAENTPLEAVIETKVLSNIQPQDFSASLSDVLPFRASVVVALIVMVIIGSLIIAAMLRKDKATAGIKHVTKNKF